jgi:hypothetical protein
MARLTNRTAIVTGASMADIVHSERRAYADGYQRITALLRQEGWTANRVPSAITPEMGRAQARIPPSTTNSEPVE